MAEPTLGDPLRAMAALAAAKTMTLPKETDSEANRRSANETLAGLIAGLTEPVGRPIGWAIDRWNGNSDVNQWYREAMSNAPVASRIGRHGGLVLPGVGWAAAAGARGRELAELVPILLSLSGGIDTVRSTFGSLTDTPNTSDQKRHGGL